MAEPIVPVSTSSAASNVATAGNPAAAAAAASGTMPSSISSLQALQQESPQLYNTLMQGMAEGMMNQLQTENDQEIQIIKDAEQQDNQS